MRGRWQSIDYNVPVRICEVTVHPDDLVVGDDDGTPVIPAEVSNDDVLWRILAGAQPLEAYGRYRQFLPAHESRRFHGGEHRRYNPSELGRTYSAFVSGREMRESW